MKLQAGPNWRTASEDPADYIIVSWGHKENIIAATYFRRSQLQESVRTGRAEKAKTLRSRACGRSATESTTGRPPVPLPFVRGDGTD